MRNSLKRQINEVVTRIDFPMIVYSYKTGRIIAQNMKAEHIIGKNINNINKIWLEHTKLKLRNDILNNGSAIFYKKEIVNKKEVVLIDIEVSSVVLDEEPMVVALFEQSYKRPFLKNNRKKVPILLWRDKIGNLIGSNTLLEKEMEQNFIAKRFEDVGENELEFRNIINQYKQLLKTKESQFDIIQEVILEDGKRKFSKLNRIALTNKNNTTVGIFTIYTLMLEDEEIQCIQDDIQREVMLLEKVVSQTGYIAVSFKEGGEGVVDYISPNVKKWGYCSENFYEESLSFQQIIVKEDCSMFQCKNIDLKKEQEKDSVIFYRICKKSGEIILVKDETIGYVIKNGDKYRQAILSESNSITK